jgi:Fur family ferric uptake transcriptional regulator
MRLSTARRLVLDALFAADGPVSASYLAKALHVDESSVYRNLETLERHGVVRHVHLGHGPGLYTLVNRPEVHYLYCESCDAVTEAAPDELEPILQAIRDQFGHEPDFHHFAIVGRCRRCAGRPRGHEEQTGVPHQAEDHVHNHQVAERHPSEAHRHLHSHGDYLHSHPHTHEPDHRQAH